MAVVKNIPVRVLVSFTFEDVQFKSNQVVEFPAVTVAAFKALGWVDDDKAAVAYALQNSEA